VLDNVPVGRDRVLRAQAFIGTVDNVDARGALAFAGEISGIRVRFGQVTDAGVLALRKVDGQRVPRLDDQPPTAPTNVVASAVPAGSALSVTFTPPPDDDVAGYIVTITATASAAPPQLRRGEVLPMGALVGDSRIVAIVDRPQPFEPVRLAGLIDGQRYTVHVFAYDADLDNQPLNYSAATPAAGVPQDTARPGPPGSVTITSSTGATAAISFVGAGEDGELGTPTAYDVRASTTQALLLDPASFENLRQVPGPQTIPAPQARAAFFRSFTELGVKFSEPFWVGMRAIDGSGNVGPVTVGEYTVPATIAVSLDGIALRTRGEATSAVVDPPILHTDSDAGGRPERTVQLLGQLFGVDTGTVTLDGAAGAGRWVLPIIGWTDDVVTCAVPDDARGGTLSVHRADRRGSGSLEVAVMRVEPNELVATRPPFAFEQAANRVSAIYGAQGAFPNGYESTVIRVVDAASEGTRYEPYQTRVPLTAVAGTYSATVARFAFVANTANLRSLTAAVVNTSTTAPVAQRRQEAAAIGDADGLGLLLLDTATPQAGLPALLAASRGGEISVSTTADLIGAGFGALTTITTSGAASFVTLARRRAGGATRYLLAYAEGSPARLGLAVATGTGSTLGTFTRAGVLSPPDVSEQIRVLDDGGFIIAYEARLPDGRRDVRLLRRSDYGRGPGLAPMPVVPQDRRFEDAGLVIRGGASWVAVLTTRWDVADVILEYTEVPVSALVADGRSDTRPMELARARTISAPAARLTCHSAPSSECAIAWLGEVRPSVLFVRR